MQAHRDREQVGRDDKIHAPPARVVALHRDPFEIVDRDEPAGCPPVGLRFELRCRVGVPEDRVREFVGEHGSFLHGGHAGAEPDLAARRVPAARLGEAGHVDDGDAEPLCVLVGGEHGHSMTRTTDIGRTL